MGDLRDVLVRASLDEDFRVQLRADPDTALASYALSSDERIALLAGDDTARALLAAEVPEGDGPQAPAAVRSAPSAVITGDESAFRVRVQPLASRRADGGVHVEYVAGIDPPVRPRRPGLEAARLAVSQAVPEERADRLLDLVTALLQERRS